MAHEYAFDLTLIAAVRIHANTEAEARAKLKAIIDCADLSIDYGTIIGEVSLFDDEEPKLYEVDGTELAQEPTDAH